VSKNQDDALAASRMLSYGLIDPSPLLDVVKPMSEIGFAMQRAIEPDSYRVVIEPFA
jgi:hypothetical protein